MAMAYLILPYFVQLMFIPLIFRTTYRIVLEKEMKTKEIMRMMGMKTGPYWWSWFVYFTMINTALCMMAIIILTLPKPFGVIKRTSPLVLFVALWLYGQSIFSFIMLLQSFFTNARIAAVFTTIFYFGTAVSFSTGENATTFTKVACSLAPTSAMAQTVKVITGMELNGLGIDLSNIDKRYRNFSVSIGCTMLIISFMLMTGLGLYFE